MGNRLTQTIDGITTNYLYDNANRLTSVNGQTYTWDNNGNLLNDGVNTYVYDQANRLVSITSNQSSVISFAYNGLGDRLRQTVDGVTTNYALDLNSGLTQVLADGTNSYLYGVGRVAQYDNAMQYFGADGLGSVRQIYNAAGQLTSMTFGNGLQTTYGYDAQNLRLMTLQTSGSNQDLSYTYDNVGNVKTITDNLLSQISQFNYDDLNRLKDASIAGVYAQAWSYNPIGNILTFTDGGNVKNYSYNDTAHKHAVTQAGANYFCYDQNGNMTRRNATSSSCTNGDTLSYDVENWLTSITVGATTTNYFYNGDGARVKKTANGVTTYYVGTLYEYTTWNGGSSVSKYYYFGGQRVAVKQDINISYIHGDHLGSTSKTTGASSSTQTYYPYGAIKTSSGTPPTDYDYTGQKRDASANLMYYGARYYDPALARFIQPDTIVPNPLDPQSLNRYAYVRNNPVNRIDPTGHEDCAPEDNWCWENRWYEAHGYCWSDAKQDWTKQCQPEFQDEDILKEVLGEEGGLAIVARANPLRLIPLLLAAAMDTAWDNRPNTLTLGISLNASGFINSGSIFLQYVFDFKHNQIGLFGGLSGFGAGLGRSFLPTFPGVSAGFQIGIAWCGNHCTSIDKFKGISGYGGASGITPAMWGLGLDGAVSGDTVNGGFDPDNVVSLTFSVLGGSPSVDRHLGLSYSDYVLVGSYGNNDQAMSFATQTIVSLTTDNASLGGYFGLYAYLVTYEPPQ